MNSRFNTYGARFEKTESQVSQSHRRHRRYDAVEAEETERGALALPAQVQHGAAVTVPGGGGCGATPTTHTQQWI